MKSNSFSSAGSNRSKKAATSGLAGVLILALGTPAVVALSGLPLFAVGLLWLVVGPLRQLVDQDKQEIMSAG